MCSSVRVAVFFYDPGVRSPNTKPESLDVNPNRQQQLCASCLFTFCEDFYFCSFSSSPHPPLLLFPCLHSVLFYISYSCRGCRSRYHSHVAEWERSWRPPCSGKSVAVQVRERQGGGQAGGVPQAPEGGAEPAQVRARKEGQGSSVLVRESAVVLLLLLYVPQYEYVVALGVGCGSALKQKNRYYRRVFSFFLGQVGGFCCRVP